MVGKWERIEQEAREDELKELERELHGEQRARSRSPSGGTGVGSGGRSLVPRTQAPPGIAAPTTRAAMAEQETRAARRDWWVALGLFVSALSAAVSSFAGLHALALSTGWHPWAAPLFLLTVDCYALTAVRVWLARSTRSARARRFARANAVGAILLSVLGNATWHLVAAELVSVTWVVVVLVGAVPPVVLGLVAHLAVLRTQDDEDGPEDEAVLRAVPAVLEDEPGTGGTVPSPDSAVPEPERMRTEPAAAVPGTTSPSPAVRRYATEDELLAAARAIDARYRARYGKPITRDQLRRELRIGGQRATEVLRRLREEATD
jgi:hypothetical protein